MTKDYYILIYFGWVPPNGILSGEKWSIIKECGTFKLKNGETTNRITKKEIINGIYWKNSDNEYISEEDLPDFTTREGYCWLVRSCFKYNILISTNNVVPIFTTAYFVRFRDILYDLLKEKKDV